MQIILTKPVRNLGKVGEVVNVKNGYGRNFLIPQDLAIRATKDNIAKFSAIQKDLEKKNSENKTAMEKAAKALDGKHFIFVTQSGADGKLFGSVSLKLIASSISKETDIKLSYSNILLDDPIKFNGVYKVKLALHPEIIASVLVVVAKSDSEAKDALQEYKNPAEKNETAEENKKES